MLIGQHPLLVICHVVIAAVAAAHLAKDRAIDVISQNPVAVARHQMVVVLSAKGGRKRLSPNGLNPAPLI